LRYSRKSARRFNYGAREVVGICAGFREGKYHLLIGRQPGVVEGLSIEGSSSVGALANIGFKGGKRAAHQKPCARHQSVAC